MGSAFVTKKGFPAAEEGLESSAGETVRRFCAARMCAAARLVAKVKS